MGLLSGLLGGGGGNNAGGGFFGSGAKNQETNTQYNTTTNTDQLDQSGNSGLNLSNTDASFDSHDSTVLTNRETNTTIYTAIDGGALKEAGAAIAGGLELARKATSGALDFGTNAVDQIARLNSNSLDLFAELTQGAFDSARSLARDSMDANARATTAAVEGFGALAKQSSESTDDKVSKVAAYGLVAIAAILILPALFRGGGKAVIA